MEPPGRTSPAPVDPDAPVSPAANASLREADSVSDPRSGETLRSNRTDALPPVLTDLANRAYRFDFFQAVWLLEQHLGAEKPEDLFRPGPPRAPAARIRILPSAATAFPAADVRRVTLQTTDTSGPRADVEVTFMGLYGVNAPLPSYFADRIIRDPDDGGALRRFLDLLNHRIYVLLYRGWKRFRPLRALSATSRHRPDAGAHRHLQVFRSLSGLGVHGTSAGRRSPASRGGSPSAARPRPAHHPAHLHWAAFAGRLSGHVRNREGLEVLLRNTLGVPVRVEENVGRWAALRTRPTMGRESRRPLRLGRAGIVGGRLFDVAGKFRIVLGPLDLDTYRSLRPGGEAARLLQSVVTLYLIEPLDYDVDLRLDPDELAPTALGDAQSRVGSTARLGRPPAEAVSEVVAYPPHP